VLPDPAYRTGRVPLGAQAGVSTGRAERTAVDGGAGEAALAVRDAHVSYFSNQATHMVYDRYHAAGWDIGSGMVDSVRQRVIATCAKGTGMRWSEAEAHTVAAVRVLLRTDHWEP
jgi:hypothetical protein